MGRACGIWVGHVNALPRCSIILAMILCICRMQLKLELTPSKLNFK